ncbi:DUF4920 domain-containing protein [Salinimicrobium tongyeongense]|jgi:hypothetical protein|uniref:DUF4920 domain-containing protein n=1 Tax=Salinimicrobium tongyeongense TaxID=2809707 RepID=A0ABY6NPX2_9FLAO|nr:DUF4920 domain-containing protein [Salinimicrobium tongyeongense]UZH54618.1 DUF4920 domain-containing protein [Salinimicrobium tongyeongense]
MKKIRLLLLLSSLMISFSGFSQEKETAVEEVYFSVGEEVETINVLSAQRMQERYNSLKPGDTLNVTFKGNVASVCKKKGCWMKVALEDEREVMVKFKDYAFFVPKDIENREVIMEGKAYVTEMSVEDRRHYAEDAGKSPAEVKAITSPEITLSFVANGVKIKE